MMGSRDHSSADGSLRSFIQLLQPKMAMAKAEGNYVA